MKKESGFSLTEVCVLVCLASLTLLLALPLWAGYQVDAETTGCRSNLRALSFALHTYARDHDGWMPAREEFEVVVRRNEYAFTYPRGFTYHVLKLHERGYIDEPALWKCPSDHWNGPNANIAVFVADSFEEPFNSWQNVSYLYVAGFNIQTTSENPALVPILADESNEIENGTLTPGAIPPLTDLCNHGDSYRNVLYLGGQILAITGMDTVNAIFDDFVNPAILQVVD